MTLSVPLYTCVGCQIVCILYPTHYILTPYTHASVYILLHEDMRVSRAPESLCICILLHHIVCTFFAPKASLMRGVDPVYPPLFDLYHPL